MYSHRVLMKLLGGSKLHLLSFEYQSICYSQKATTPALI